MAGARNTEDKHAVRANRTTRDGAGMTQEKWVRITRCENIPLREGRAVRVGNRDIAVFNLGGRFLAVENRCPHQAGPLADGIISGNTVVCPLHAWKVDLECGAV